MRILVELYWKLIPLISFIVGIATFFAPYKLFDTFGHAMGVPILAQRYVEPMWIGNRYYEGEVDYFVTAYGYASIAICIMLASRVGMAIYHQSWKGSVDAEDESSFLAWLIGLFSYSMIAMLIYLASAHHDYGFRDFIFQVMHIFAIGSIACTMKQWRNKRIAKLREKTISETE